MAKRRYFNRTVNGVHFTYDAKGGKMPTESIWDYSSIWVAYDRPSRIKENIWRDWYNWFIDNGGECWVDSRNCFKFTITGYVIDSETGEVLGIHITDTKHTCWSITK